MITKFNLRSAHNSWCINHYTIITGPHMPLGSRLMNLVRESAGFCLLGVGAALIVCSLNRTKGSRLMSVNNNGFVITMTNKKRQRPNESVSDEDSNG